MKKITTGLLTAVIMLFSLSNATAQKTSRPQNVNASVVINKPASEVWKVFATIDGLEKLIPSILSETHIEGDGKAKEGCVRNCKSAQGNITREKVIELNAKQMYYAYEFVEGVPAKMINSFKVIALDDTSCKVIWNADYSFIQNPMMDEAQFFAFVNNTGQKMMDEVRIYFSM